MAILPETKIKNTRGEKIAGTLISRKSPRFTFRFETFIRDNVPLWNKFAG
ncbi:hypothetical protein PUATCC27989T_02180 [Phytobacter ursingii]|nr:hypothetical protein PUATCC27989T_02180 [Phytobacter ursingii]